MRSLRPSTTGPTGGAAIRSRGIGMLVGAGFGAWWAFAALKLEPVLQAWPIEAVIALVTGILLAAGALTIWRGSRIASTPAAAQHPRRRVWSKFLLILVAEIVALNLVAWALAHFQLMSCLLPTIAIIVGLHFYPLARLFRAPYMHITATVMTMAGAGAVLAIVSGSSASLASAAAAVICAIALWMTAAIGWMQNRDVLAALRDGVAAIRVDEEVRSRKAL